LDDITKEKSIAEEINNKYGIDKGSRGMIIKQITKPTMIFVTKLMACKLLRRCCKEEAPAGVIEAFVQCAKGSLLSWAPYLLKKKKDDCKDA
jgi:hypothetical protein